MNLKALESGAPRPRSASESQSPQHARLLDWGEDIRRRWRKGAALLDQGKPDEALEVLGAALVHCDSGKSVGGYGSGGAKWQLGPAHGLRLNLLKDVLDVAALPIACMELSCIVAAATFLQKF